MVHGAIGLDFNDGHIDLAETDGKGNLVAMDRYRLKYHGTGGRAANEMRQVTAEIGKYALSKGKSIVKEYLSFARKKSQTEKGSGKRYNRMLHTLDYSRYEDDIRNMAVRNGIDLIEVNPAYTSQIAETKYCPIRKIPVHNGAAYVIARKGQGYKDKAV
jgi:IS605 OrfB family transposase